MADKKISVGEVSGGFPVHGSFAGGDKLADPQGRVIDVFDSPDSIWAGGVDAADLQEAISRVAALYRYHVGIKVPNLASLTITTPLVQDYLVNEAISFELTSSGGLGAKTWMASFPPSWLTEAPAGIFSGSSPYIGSFDVPVEVTDASALVMDVITLNITRPWLQPTGYQPEAGVPTIGQAVEFTTMAGIGILGANLYVADWIGGKINWYSLATGVPLTSIPVTSCFDVAGGGGMLWRVNGANIQRTNPDGTGAVLAVDGTGVLSARAIAVDDVGNFLYAYDESVRQVKKFDISSLPASNASPVWTSTIPVGTGSEELATDSVGVPRGLAVDVAAGKVYLTDYGISSGAPSKVLVLNAGDGGISFSIGVGVLTEPAGVVVDAGGGTYVANQGGFSPVSVFDPSGNPTATFGSFAGEFSSTGDITYDIATNRIYTTDPTAKTVRVYEALF